MFLCYQCVQKGESNGLADCPADNKDNGDHQDRLAENVADDKANADQEIQVADTTNNGGLTESDLPPEAEPVVG